MKVVVIEKGMPPRVEEFDKELRNLDNLYKLIGCDCVTVVERKIGGEYFDIWCDDEGLIKGDKKYINGYLDDKRCNEILCGTLVIARSNEEGEMVGLNDEDVNNIIGHTAIKNYLLEEKFGIDLDDERFTELEVDISGYEQYDDLVIERDGGLLFYEL